MFSNLSKVKGVSVAKQSASKEAHSPHRIVVTMVRPAAAPTALIIPPASVFVTAGAGGRVVVASPAGHTEISRLRHHLYLTLRAARLDSHQVLAPACLP